MCNAGIVKIDDNPASKYAVSPDGEHMSRGQCSLSFLALSLLGAFFEHRGVGLMGLKPGH